MPWQWRHCDCAPPAIFFASLRGFSCVQRKNKQEMQVKSIAGHQLSLFSSVFLLLAATWSNSNFSDSKNRRRWKKTSGPTSHIKYWKTESHEWDADKESTSGTVCPVGILICSSCCFLWIRLWAFFVSFPERSLSNYKRHNGIIFCIAIW